MPTIQTRSVKTCSDVQVWLEKAPAQFDSRRSTYQQQADLASGPTLALMEDFADRCSQVIGAMYLGSHCITIVMERN
jgi:hypothetical protein